jgi:RNA polymerase sigma-70 factor (ECF subfamily)
MVPSGSVACPVRPVAIPEEPVSDEALLDGMASGSEESTLTFVRRFQARVYGIALALSGDGRLAEDIASETFRQATRLARTHDSRRNSVSEWLLSLARETAIGAVRSRGLAPPERTAPLAVVDGAGGRPGHHDRTGKVAAALGQLGAEGYRALILAGISGLTAAEVASVEGIPLATAKMRIRAAMDRLRVLLKEGEP